MDICEDGHINILNDSTSLLTINYLVLTNFITHTHLVIDLKKLNNEISVLNFICSNIMISVFLHVNQLEKRELMLVRY